MSPERSIPLVDNAASHLNNALQVSTLFAAELPRMIGNPGQLHDATKALVAIDDRIRSALALINPPAGNADDFPKFVDGELFKRQYPTQHPAEAALDYIAAAARDHTSGPTTKLAKIQAAVLSFFDWKAART